MITTLQKRNRKRGIMLIETLTYIAVMVLVLGAGGSLLYQVWGSHIALRHNADDIVNVLDAGELWRADVRNATGPINLTINLTAAQSEELRIPTADGSIVYSFADDAVRRQQENKPARVLTHVKSSHMHLDKRDRVTAWQWEVELVSNRKKIQFRPLFSFEAVANAQGTK